MIVAATGHVLYCLFFTDHEVPSSNNSKRGVHPLTVWQIIPLSLLLRLDVVQIILKETKSPNHQFKIEHSLCGMHHVFKI